MVVRTVDITVCIAHFSATERNPVRDSLAVRYCLMVARHPHTRPPGLKPGGSELTYDEDQVQRISEFMANSKTGPPLWVAAAI